MSKLDAQEAKARLAGQWSTVISTLCRVDPAILDGDHHPCPKCGGTKRFNLCREGSGAAYCNDCPGGPNIAGSGIDTIMWLNGWDFPRTMRELEDYLSPPVAAVSDDVRQLRHRVYTKLESIFPLNEANQADLKQRGLSELEIRHRGYWSAPMSAALGLLSAFSAERPLISRSVPGVMPGGSLKIAASSSMMIPVRNADGEVIALQYKPDRRRPGTPKYLWFSSKESGVSPGSPCHFALPPAEQECAPKIVRLTEGPLKADIATAMSGIRTLAIAGVNSWKAGVAGVKSLSPEFVWLAFDSDAFTNPGVARAAVDTYEDLLASGMLVQIETWNGEHKGIDDALVAKAETNVLSIEDTKKAIDKLRKVATEKQEAGKLRNFKLVPSKSNNPEKVWDKEPLAVPEIAANLLKITDGWPKACDGVLFVKGEDGEIRRLIESNGLFGWIGKKSPAEFSGGEGLVNKKEFFCELPHHVESFIDTEEWPHFPPRPNYYYSRTYSPGEGTFLNQFLDFFSPATVFDRQLIIAFIATTFWGGSPGRRVAFGIDSVSGTGAGKSELAKRVSGLTGGCYEFDAADIKEETIRKALMNGQRHRVALLDNIKESCLSSATVESLITSSAVGGHRLNVGYGSRPNTITWVMTMNGMSLSRDLAQRTVVIKLSEPKRSGTWDDDVDRFIAEHRDDVIADVAGFFARQGVTLERFTRWASWEREILAKLDNPPALQKIIDSRAGEADEDKKTASSFREYAEERLRDLGYDTDDNVIHIPTQVATDWLMESSGKEFSKRSANAAIKNLIDGGSLRNINLNPCRSNGRGWIWNSGHSRDNVLYTLQDTIDAKKKRDSFF